MKLIILLLFIIHPAYSKTFEFASQTYTIKEGEHTLDTALKNVLRGHSTGKAQFPSSDFETQLGGSSLLDFKVAVEKKTDNEKTDQIKTIARLFKKFLKDQEIITREDKPYSFEKYLGIEIESPVLRGTVKEKTCEEKSLETIQNYQVSVATDFEDPEIYEYRVKSLLAQGYPCKVDDKKIELPTILKKEHRLNFIKSLLLIAEKFGHQGNLIFDLLRLNTENSRQERIKNFLLMRAVLFTQLGKLDPVKGDRNAFLINIPELTSFTPSEKTSRYLKEGRMTRDEIQEVFNAL